MLQGCKNENKFGVKMEHDIEDLIAQLSFRVRLARDAKKTEETKGISEKDITILEFLEHFTTGEGLPFSDIKKFFEKISSGTVSRALQRLYLRGYLERLEFSEDRQSKLFSVTEKGRGFLASVKDSRTLIYTLIVSHLSLKPKEAKILTEIIPRAIKNFDEMLGLTEPGVHGEAIERK
jgi:DNA-binding MarR family transcriptional regulator